MSAVAPGLPAGFRLAFDTGARFERGGSLLLGGEPFTLFSLAPEAAAAVAAWRAGAPVGDAPGGPRLARELVAANLARPLPPAAEGAPGVSLVIPVRDRPFPLARLLATVAGDPAVRQVVVVDDGSARPEETRRVADSAGAELVLRPRAGGPGAARNAGLARAGSPFVAFVDSDCVPRPGWLGALLPHFEDPAVALVAPRVVPVTEPTDGAVARYEAVRSPLDRGPHGAAVRPGGHVPFVPGAALVARRSAVGAGFDEALRGGEDVELAWRLGAGGGVRYEPAAVVEHHQAGDLGGWLHRRVAYGRSAAPLARRRPGALRPLAISPWTGAAWAAAALRRPLAATAITGAACALLARRLQHETADPAWAARTALELAGGGSLRAGRAIADAAVRTWAPASLLAAALLPRARLPLAAAALVPALLDRRAQRAALDPLRWIALRIADDLAYGCGVWAGCIAEGNWDPVRPDLGWRLVTRDPVHGMLSLLER